MRILRRLLIAVAVIVGALAVVYLLRAPLLRVVGNFLVIRDPLETADIVFLLNGDVAVRPMHVAKLMQV